ncbi:MAG: ornithine carbamoyltransferase [Anaerolineae bacterium]
MKKDFLSLADINPEKTWALLELALQLKHEQAEGKVRSLLSGKTLAMVFQKPSLRTRVSFEMAMIQAGGRALYISPDEIKLGQRESVPDVARVLSRYVDAIMGRVFAHQDIIDLAKWATVPVINGLSDYSHPCQGMADLLTIYEKLGTLKGIKLAYVGDGNNVLHSLLLGGANTGMRIWAATPAGYEPMQAVIHLAQERAKATGAEIMLLSDPQKAVADTDVIYTDTWTSMGQEDESALRRQVFPPYQVNETLVSLGSKQVGVMHCLPAHRGEEITNDVADGPHSWLFDQAENRLHAQKAVLVDLLGG